MKLTGSIDKVSSALALLRSCLGKKGIWASPDRYRNTCWTRDLAYAIAPVLLEMGEFEPVRNHLEHLSALQRPNGQIPMVFLDNEEEWLRDKEQQERDRGREPFMLKRYREGELWNLTPGTRDSEICYLLAMLTYANATWDTEFLQAHTVQIEKAFQYIETELMRDGLVIGCDWRDTMHEELGEKALLTNNVLLTIVYALADRYLQEPEKTDRYERKGTELRRAIQNLHGQDSENVLDYVGNERIDPLGLAFHQLSGLFPELASFAKQCHTVDSPHGVTIRCRHKPGAYSTGDEARVIEETDGVVVWPFVVGSVVVAATELGQNGLARNQFEKLHALEGFWEWYDPRTGKGYGAPGQLWSAALYLRAFFALI